MKRVVFSLPGYAHRTRIVTPALILGAVLTTTSLAITPADLDTDSDGLADAWEIKHFNGLSHVDGDPTGDPDGDGKDNSNECNANTNPNDNGDCLQIVDTTFDPDTAMLCWATVPGKKYSLEVSDDLTNWISVESTPGNNLAFRGSGGPLKADFSDPANPMLTGAATRELWFGLGSIPADLGAHFAGLGAPAATQWHPHLKGPSDDGENYSARYRGFIIPETTGAYTFYIASRGPSEWWLSTDDNPANIGASPACELAANDLLTEEDWNADPSQKSVVRALIAGVKYYFEIRHVHDTGFDHLAVAWQDGAGPIVVVPGECLSPIEDLSAHNAATLFNGSVPKFASAVAHGPLSGDDFDADLDGIDDATELDLAQAGFDPYNANATGHGSGNDGDTLAALLAFNPLTQNDEVSVVATDNQAVELLDPPLVEDSPGVPNPGNIVNLDQLASHQTGTSTDTISFRISRTKSLLPVTIFWTFGGGASGEEPAATSPNDFTAVTTTGEDIGSTLLIPPLASGVDIDVTVNRDTTHEYPEKIQCEITSHPDYDIAAGKALAKAEIVDMPSSVNILFVGAFTADFNATPGSSHASGSVSGYLKGDKRMFILRNDNFGNLSSEQIDTHFHKVKEGGTSGTPPIHDIIGSPGEALLGRYLTYDWDITTQNPVTPIPLSGGPSRQVVIDSLFNQNSQTRLYVNLHTDSNPGGETMAILEPATGSPSAPAPPADPPALPLLSGADLERDIVRFLNQATFGAAWEDVQAIKTAIETERTTGNPTYHRVEEFEKWIETQCKMDQTFILDYALALDCLEFNLRGLWDPDEWNDWSASATNPNNAGDPDVEPIPTTWPSINRSLTNGPAPGMPDTHPHFWANQWYPEGRYPTDTDWIGWMDDESDSEGTKTVRNLGQQGPQYRNRRRAHWMMMVNAKDQLRHKWGYAIQQIIVVADTLTQIRDRHYSAANYQDMLNYYGLPSDRDGSDSLDSNEQTYFRNLIGYANWSPVMGYWLSSIRNRAAYDSDGNGSIDVYPDENLARENMQLFTIGLFNRWLDGSLQLQSAGDPNTPPGSSATYTNDDIQEFARILTGQNTSRRTQNGRSPTIGWNGVGHREGNYGWGIESTGPYPDSGDVFDTDNTNGDSDAGDGDDGIYYNTSFTQTTSGNRFIGHAWNYPMRMFGKNGTAIYHDLGVKTIAGGRVIDNTGLLSNQNSPEDSTDDSMIALGVADIEAAMDWFGGKVDGNAGPDFTGDAGDSNASHASTPPFITRRLIQRMVTSNPSSAYLYRVSKAFKDSEGNMLDVCKAVLLDHEARSLDNITETYGMKKSPLEAYIHVLRAWEAHSLLPLTDDNSLSPFDGSWPTASGGYDPGTYAAAGSDPQEDIYASSYGYPAGQRDNFRFNCLFQYPITDATLSMTPFAQETVFNYYLPDFTTGVVQSAALVAPELQIATETEVVNNHNYFWTITWNWNTNRSSKSDGQDVEELGGSNLNQRMAFSGTTSGGDWDHHDKVRVDFVRWGNELYEQKSAAGDRTANSLEAEDLIDKIDQRLTGGSFKAAYPYDAFDDDSNLSVDATTNPREPLHGDGNPANDVDKRNPREWLIRAVAESYGDGSSEGNRRDKFRLALYLFSVTPEYLVKK